MSTNLTLTENISAIGEGYESEASQATSEELNPENKLNCSHECKIKMAALEAQIQDLKMKLKRAKWGIERIRDDNNATRFYTGMPTFALFLWLFEFLKPRAETMAYWRSGRSQTSQKTNRALSKIDEFLAVMIRLKVGLFTRDIAERFQISTGVFSEIFRSCEISLSLD
uniref:Transposase Helix-turn-helix domain-containing protein n=1 Tax=Strigamia maritima TaxID=126957 RepID=T1IIP1_STRMM